MSKQNGIDVTKLDSVIDRVDNIVLSNVFDKHKSDSVGKYVLNIKTLTKTLMSSILQINNVPLNSDIPNVSTSTSTSTSITTTITPVIPAPIPTVPTELIKITNFLEDIANAVNIFCDFLDYDRDGIVELVGRDQEGKIIEGQDIDALLKDLPDIKSAFKNQKDVCAAIIAVISSIAMYFTSENFSHTKNEFILFKSACETAYTSCSQIKSINYQKFFKDNSTDVMNFVILLCIIVVPVVELVNKKVASIQNDSLDDKLVITSDEIKRAITDMYGVNLDFVLNIVHRLSDIFIRAIKPIKTGFFSKFSKCCCCH
jgi:hypothetical protein